jgi:hypothetical protein
MNAAELGQNADSTPAIDHEVEIGSFVPIALLEDDRLKDHSYAVCELDPQQGAETSKESTKGPGSNLDGTHVFVEHEVGTSESPAPIALLEDDGKVDSKPLDGCEATLTTQPAPPTTSSSNEKAKKVLSTISTILTVCKTLVGVASSILSILAFAGVSICPPVIIPLFIVTIFSFILISVITFALKRMESTQYDTEKKSAMAVGFLAEMISNIAYCARVLFSLTPVGSLIAGGILVLGTVVSFISMGVEFISDYKRGSVRDEYGKEGEYLVNSIIVTLQQIFPGVFIEWVSKKCSELAGYYGAKPKPTEPEPKPRESVQHPTLTNSGEIHSVVEVE